MKKLTLVIALLYSSMTFSMDLKEITLIRSYPNVSVITKTLPFDLKFRVDSIAPVIINVSNSLKVDPQLVLSVTWTESHFKENSHSRKGARGLMQVLPSTRKQIIKQMSYDYNLLFTQNLHSGLEAKEIEDIIVGSYYLGMLVEKFDNNVDHAIIAYNMGHGWLNKQLNRNRIVGNKNKYLDKVKDKLRKIALR